MRIWFSTVNRKAPIERGGDVVLLDWAAKRVLRRVPIVPSDPAIDDPNPRGNTRGGRGIALLPDSGEALVASYHSLLLFDRELNHARSVSHPLFASIHEIARSGAHSFLVSSTAIDAALEIDVRDGKLIRSYFPREDPRFQSELGLTPLAIDKDADNRARFLANDHFQHPHHLHLNAVAFHAGEPLALFSKPGCIANLERGTIVVRDPALKGAHNLLVAEGRAYVNHSVGKGVLVFDLTRDGGGRRIRHVGYGNEDAVRRLVRFAEPLYRLRRSLERIGVVPVRASRPLFARGLARHGGRLFVGVSPASILEIDEPSGRLAGMFTWSRDVDCCVHGLEVDPGAP